MNREVFEIMMNERHEKLAYLPRKNQIINHSIMFNYNAEKDSYRGFKNANIVREELSELDIEISKYSRGKGSHIGLIEEMADVLLCIDYLQQIFEVSDVELQKAMDIKLERECRRITVKAK